MPVRVVAVDDDDNVRKMIRAYFQGQKDLNLVADVGSAVEALAVTQALRPDVVIMDIRLPDSDGVSLTAKLHEALPEIKIVAISGFTEAFFIRAMMSSGAQGFVSKPMLPAVLLEAVREVMTSDIPYFCPRAKRIVEMDYMAMTRERGLASDEEFQWRERLILWYAGQDLTARKVATRLGMKTRTVEDLIGRMLKRQGVGSTLELVKKARKDGHIPDA